MTIKPTKLKHLCMYEVVDIVQEGITLLLSTSTKSD